MTETMTTTCTTCADGTCARCTTPVTTIALERALATLRTDIENYVGHECVLADDLEGEVERLIDDADLLTQRDAEREYVTESDMESAIESALDDGDYAKRDELEDAVSEALGDAEIVKDAAAGAVAAMLAQRDKFATKAEMAALVQALEDRLNADAPKRLADLVQGLTFTQRVRLLFGGAR